MTALAILLALTAPYQNVTLADGSTASYDVSITPQVAPGQWAYSLGPLPSPVGSYQQALVIGLHGENDANLRMLSTGIQTSRYNDPTYDISSPWKQNGAFVPAYVRVWAQPPVGASNGEVWWKAGLTLRTNRSKIFVRVTGCPWQSLDLLGNDNDVTVYCTPGPQSRLIQGLATVRVRGSGNKVHGYAEGEMTALWVQGRNNSVSSFTARGGSVGDDSGLVYVASNSDGFSMKDVSLYCTGRIYQPSHGAQAVYIDDKTSYVTITDCLAQGFPRGIFTHGSNYVTVKSFTSWGNGIPVVFSPYFKTPTMAPIGCTAVGTVQVVQP